MNISSGVVIGPQKVVIYGPEGIGKSSIAGNFPNPVFMDIEDGTKHMDVKRTPKPSSWSMLLEQVKYFKKNPHVCDTLVIDTADWAEQLCMSEICATYQKTGIEEFGYGKGYIYLVEEFGKLLNSLSDLIELGMNVVLLAHAQMRKFEQPDEMGSYDRWEMKLQKKTAPLVKEWADMVLFANYQTIVVNSESNGKGTNKVQGGKRVMHTSHHPCWDAKNRHDLKPILPLDYKEIAHCIPLRNTKPVSEPKVVTPAPKPEPEKPVSKPAEPKVETPKVEPPKAEPPKVESPLSGVPKPLADLMKENDVTPIEIQKAVASKGYYPIDTPIANYDSGFISGVLVAAWAQVFKMIQDIREDETPF